MSDQTDNSTTCVITKEDVKQVSRLRRFGRGCASTATGLVFPLGKFWPNSSCGPERLEHGLTLILPGVEGAGFFNVNIAKGLIDGGVKSAVEVYDWTTGWALLGIYHLRAKKRHRREAKVIAERIVNYQQEYPGRPVHLIGYSGGGGVALYAIEALPPGVLVNSAVLLAPAVSSQYDLTAALKHTSSGIVNFYSPFDVVFLGFITGLFGNIDGRHGISSGCSGFRATHSKLSQRKFERSMLRQFHYGGHFGWLNRVFAAEQIAPLVM